MHEMQSLPFAHATMRRMSTNNENPLEAGSGASPAKRGFRVPAWAVVLAVAVVLIVLGIIQGDALDVWRKASLICYECIGIG